MYYMYNGIKIIAILRLPSFVHQRVLYCSQHKEVIVHTVSYLILLGYFFNSTNDISLILKANTTG